MTEHLFESAGSMHKCIRREATITCGLRLLWGGNRKGHNREFFVNVADQQKERKRHIEKSRLSIHPFSIFRFVWELYMIPLFLYSSLRLHVDPNSIYSDNTVLISILWEKTVIVDVLLNFVTGYIDHDNNVHLKIKDISSHYLRTYFLFDVIRVFPYELLLLSENYVQQDIFSLLSMIQMIEFLHVVPVSRYIKNIGEALGVELIYCRLLITFLIFVFIADLGAKILWINAVSQKFLGIDTDKANWANLFLQSESIWSFNKVYLFALSRSLSMLTLTSTSVAANGPLDNIVTTLLQITGSVYMCTLLCQVLLLFVYLNHTSCSYEEIRNMLIDHFPKRQVSIPDQQLILDHFDYKYFPDYYNEIELMDMMTAEAKKCLLFEKYQRFLIKSTFFGNLPFDVIDKTTSYLVEDIYLKGEVIFAYNDITDGMYFIVKGCVVVRKGQQEVICPAGDFCGSKHLTNNLARRDSEATAIDNTEVLKLSRKRFFRLVEDYPMILQKLEISQKERFKELPGF